MSGTPTASRLGCRVRGPRAGLVVGAFAGLCAVAAPQPALAEDPYVVAVSAARERMRARAWDEAAGHARAALEAADADPEVATERTIAAARLAGDIELRRDRPDRAARRYAAAARAAAAEPRLRHRLMALRRAALLRARRPQEVKRVDELVAADRKLEQLRWRAAVPRSRLARSLAEIDAAVRGYVRDRDGDRAAWARAVRALVVARSDEPEAGRGAAERLLSGRDGQVAFARRVALDAARFAARRAGDLEGEARAALQANLLDNLDLDFDVRRHRRSRIASEVCRRYERGEGPGACARLAKAVTGEYSFEDHSAGRPVKTLEPRAVEVAQAQYLPLLEECLRLAAQRPDVEDLFRDGELEIAWSIGPEGRTSEVELAPKRYEPIVGACVRERLDWFRYPRHRDGQRPHVRLPFTLGKRR
jgi:hypothetical protein